MQVELVKLSLWSFGIHELQLKTARYVNYVTPTTKLGKRKKNLVTRTLIHKLHIIFLTMERIKGK